MMARMTCAFCNQYMSNNKDDIDFIFQCFSDSLFHETVRESKKHDEEYFHLPEQTPSIWRCPQCKAIYWFEYKKNTAKTFVLNKICPIENYKNASCTCGHEFSNDELVHCYPTYQLGDLWEIIDNAFESKTPVPEFDDSKVHVWKCPDCNRLYWIERDTGLVYQYVHEILKEK